MKLSYELLMDRPFTDGHYLSPGGYAVIMEDDSVIQFDFDEYSGEIDKQNRKLVYIEHRFLDVDTFPAAVKLAPEKIKAFSEVYIYTGEADDPEINPVEIRNMCFETEQGRIWISQDVIATANAIICGSQKVIGG